MLIGAPRNSKKFTLHACIPRYFQQYSGLYTSQAYTAPGLGLPDVSNTNDGKECRVHTLLTGNDLVPIPFAMASNILPIFWNLASSSKDTRLNSSAELISSLESFQTSYISSRGEPQGSSSDEEDEEEDGDEIDDDDESGVEVDADEDSGDEESNAVAVKGRKLDRLLAKENAEDVVYTVKRLVRGLGSSRDSSRLGFAVALTEVSYHYPSSDKPVADMFQLLSRIRTVSAAQILSLLQRSTHTSGAMKGSEVRDLLFARLFGLTSLINSGSLFAATSTQEDFETVIAILLRLGKQKAWLRESAWWGIIGATEGLLGSSVPWKEDGVKGLVEKVFKEQGWTAEKVALALMIEGRRPVR